MMSRRHGMEESRASREDNDGFRRIPKDSEGFMVVLRLWRLSWACMIPRTLVQRWSTEYLIAWRFTGPQGFQAARKAFNWLLGKDYPSVRIEASRALLKLQSLESDPVGFLALEGCFSNCSEPYGIIYRRVVAALLVTLWLYGILLGERMEAYRAILLGE